MSLIEERAERPTADAEVAPQEPPHLDGIMLVPIEPLPTDELTLVLTPEQGEAFNEAAKEGRRAMEGRVVWHVNSTDKGGGVAEMLTALLPYARGSGVDARWLVIAGDEDFFRITKRIHNHLHGNDGDSPVLDEPDREHYRRLTQARAAVMRTMVGPDDLLVLHDPQTAGLIPALTGHCAGIVWRCHVGLDEPNERVRGAWDFLRPFVRGADALLFSRKRFVWSGLEDCRVEIMPPSIDPFSAKNREIDDAHVSAILDAAGIVPDPSAPKEALFERQDGSRSAIVHRADMQQTRPPSHDAPLVVQISRWDRLKDPVGVLQGFARVLGDADAELILAGPSVAEVADDPEGHDVFEEVRREWQALPAEQRERVHLACLPMDDDAENAAMVNALQRRADIVVQKSIAEGFGLTVAEAMWKKRPVIASAVGGIQDQIEDGVSGVLLSDPHDLDTFAAAIRGLLADRGRARRIGAAAHERVRDNFLGTRALMQYAQLLESLTR